VPDPTNPPDHSVVETDAHHERHRGLCHTHNRESPSRRGVNDTDHLTQQPDATSGLAADADYLDMAMSLSTAHPEQPHALVGTALGADQFAMEDQWVAAGRLALVGMGVEPGLSDVFARYAADHLFSHIDELGTRDGANLIVRDEGGNEIFAPSFSIWTTIEECLNPPVVWQKDQG